MTHSKTSDSGIILTALPAGGGRWQRRLLVLGLPLGGLLILLLLLWNIFFHYVPPGSMLVVISKNGDPLAEGQILAKEGQKGIQEDVRGEGWHFVWPILYTTELKPNVVVEPGKVGIVTALGGIAPRDGRVLAEQDDEKGIRRKVLLPGSYRINPYGFKVEQVAMTRIEPGFVGIKRRLLGIDGTTQFATKPTEKGIVKNEILEPGLYPVNTLEYQVISCEVGISQTSYNSGRGSPGAISFPARDGNTISLECTIEWELKPEHWPEWLAKYGNDKTIEQIVIDQHARKICRDRGFNYGAQDFLDGEKREQFQADFRAELDKVCKADNVVVRSAFIRNIIIPESFLEQKRMERIAVETKLTSEALTQTALSDAEVAEAKQMIEQRKLEVEAETARMVALIERETENVKTLTEAEIERMKNEYGAKIGDLDTQRKQALGEAEAEATKLKETAKSSLYKMKMELFGREGDAFLRYTMAQQLNPKMQLRLFQSGPGTLWTNMGNKNMNFMLPLPAGESKKTEGGEQKSLGQKDKN
jgi:hypothetical protein